MDHLRQSSNAQAQAGREHNLPQNQHHEIDGGGRVADVQCHRIQCGYVDGQQQYEHGGEQFGYETAAVDGQNKVNGSIQFTTIIGDGPDEQEQSHGMGGLRSTPCMSQRQAKSIDLVLQIGASDKDDEENIENHWNRFGEKHENHGNGNRKHGPGQPNPNGWGSIIIKDGDQNEEQVSC